MNKKVMAIAVAGLFAAPGVASAQKSAVEIYGRANLGFDQYEAKGATDPSTDREGRYRVFDKSSRVGLRGTEDLGNGLRAIFQIESGAKVDNGSTTGQSGATSSSFGTWASRDSFVGLDSNYGRVTFGRQEIYRPSGVNAQIGSAYLNTELPWTRGENLGRISRGVSGTETVNVAVARVSNTVQYTTPTFSGFNGTLSYSPNAQEPVQDVGSGIDADGFIWGITLRGTFGAFYGQLDYAQNNSNTAIGSPQAEGTLYKAGGS